MTTTRWTAALLVALAIARPGSADPTPAESAKPAVAPPSRDDAEIGWWDPVLGERIGLFNPARGEGAQDDARLASLGYLQGYEKGEGRSGVVAFDPERTQPGYNLYVSGHAPEARLVNMAGDTLHVWRRAFQDVCPDRAQPTAAGQRWFRRARLLRDGGLLVIFDYNALVRLDRDSRVRWVRCAPYHHDLDVDARDRIFALKAGLGAAASPSRPQGLVVDFVEVLDAAGNPAGRISLPEALAKGPHGALLGRISRADALHTNAVTVLAGSGARDTGPFRKGNLLLSMRNIDAIATLDTEEERIGWALTGSFRAQHEPSVLESGRILLFDNLGRGGRSRVVEIDPATGETGWTYPGEGGDLYSPVCGTTRRLANGNTLIIESTAGRALEVTREGDVVWDFRSPHRVTRDGEDLVAILGDVVRIPPEQVDSWLTAPQPGPDGATGPR